MVLSVAFALNDKIKTLTPYDPICGAYPIRLDANESYIPFPDEVQAEMRKALEETALNRTRMRRRSAACLPPFTAFRRSL